MIDLDSKPSRRTWPDYAAVWRWHFYAGLLCLPFFCWLAVTGSVYLFRPDIEAALDRPYETLPLDKPRAAPSAEVRAAIAAVPGSRFSHYEPPATPTGAAQVVVAQGTRFVRVYVHPGTLRPMWIGQDDYRIMDVVSHLHGNLLLGPRGSLLVEVAGSWGIVMIVTGLFLWWPRGATRAAGLLYPRLRLRGRMLWRDLHAVSGLWICVVTLFLLLSGLPWSSAWGNYLTWARNHWSATAGMPDWPVGGRSRGPVSPAMPGMSAAEMQAMPAGPQEFSAIDSIAPVAARLALPRPVWIMPPEPGGYDWAIASRAQNRPQRVTYTIDPTSGAIDGKLDFEHQNVVDRVVNVAVATHEGQLFGRANQAILLVNAIGVLLVSISAAVMWWRRRPPKVLGAPPAGVPTRFSTMLALVIALLTIILPLFGLSLLLVAIIERALLRRSARARSWLGLAAAR